MQLIDLEAYLSGDAIRRLVEVIDDREDAVVSLVDDDLNLLWASPLGSKSLFGREQQDFAGQPAARFVHPDDAGDLRDRYRRASCGDAQSWDTRALNADGTYSSVRVIAWPADGDDRVALVCITRPLV